MTQNEFNKFLLKIVLRITIIQKQESNEYNKGQIYAYSKVLELAGTSRDDISQILQEN